MFPPVYFLWILMLSLFFKLFCKDARYRYLPPIPIHRHVLLTFADTDTDTGRGYIGNTDFQLASFKTCGMGAGGWGLWGPQSYKTWGLGGPQSYKTWGLWGPQPTGFIIRKTCGAPNPIKPVGPPDPRFSRFSLKDFFPGWPLPSRHPLYSVHNLTKTGVGLNTYLYILNTYLYIFVHKDKLKTLEMPRLTK